MYPKVKSEINFISLQESHFKLVHYWFNQPHVQIFYSLRPWSSEEVYGKLNPYLKGEKGIEAFIIYLKKIPIGYIQSYPIKDNCWENQNLPEHVIQEAAGLDLFLGYAETLQKGLGSQIVDLFLERHIWPKYRYCLTDPDLKNEASLRLFLKCGFAKHKQIPFINALNQLTILQLFIKEREEKIHRM